MRRFIALFTLVLTIVGCGNDQRPTSPRPGEVDPSAEPREANPQVGQIEGRVVYVDARDNDRLESLPNGSQVAFGRAFTLPIPTAVLARGSSPDSLFHQTWRGNDITIIDGKLYQRLGEPDLSKLESEFTDLESGGKISRERMDELSDAAEVVGSWSPIRPDSAPMPDDNSYMKVFPSTSFPVFPDRSGRILFLYHSKEGLYGNRLVLYARDDRRAAELTVADLKSLLGRDSQVRVPRSAED